MSSTQRPLAGAARERLIESHLPLVKAVARRYAGRGAELDDLVQVGAIGLIKATDRFDPGRGVAFASFATPTIEGEIRHHLRDRTSALRIPRELQYLSREIRRCQGQLAGTLGRAPTTAELAAAVSAEEQDVERALAAEQARDSVPIPADDDESPPPEIRAPYEGSDERLALVDQMRALDDRERQIVYLRFHADLTEREIARQVGISQAHVSRLLTGALQKLRDELGTIDSPSDTGDTTMKPLISPANKGVPSSARAGMSKRRRGQTPAGRGADNRIRGVTGPRAKATVARYLELPYHVMVKTEREGSRAAWTASVEELPGCMARGDTPDEAVEQLRPAMEAWLTAAIAEEKEIPAPARDTAKPKTPSSHSGRFLVRMPSDLHEQLALAAERRQVSLNRYVTDALAQAVSPSPPPPADAPIVAVPATAAPPKRAPARSLRVALAANLVVVVVAGLVAVALLVLALQRGI